MEQEVEISVEDILMYSYEKSFNFVVQSLCFVFRDSSNITYLKKFSFLLL